MGRSAPQPPALKLYLSLNAAALFGAAALMTLLARSSGFSGLRLLLVGATATLALALASTAVLLHFHPAKERRLARAIAGPQQRLGTALAIVFLVFLCLTWFPPQYTGDAYYYFIGLYPLILCGLLASGLALVLIVVPGGSFAAQWWATYLRERRPAIRVALLALAAFALVALLTTQLRILHGNEPYWYGAGVPLLAAQILMAALLAVLVSDLDKWSGTKRLSADLILFALVWAIAAILWAARPVPASYWVTAPRPPNFEFYPFSDSLTYDIASQFALIGQGIYNRMFFDRALYLGFLVYLHIVGGQNYQQLMSIQAAVFAVFPALLYLVGKHLHSRTAGLVLAALIIMRGLTSLDASSWIDTATFKHMLTDFPTAIGMAGFLVLILKWMEAPRDRVSCLIWAGGVLGLTSLLRPHVLLLMAGIALLAVWLYRQHWKKALGTAALASLAFLVAVLPWMTVGPSSGSLLTLYGERVQAVIAQRYAPATLTPVPAPPTTPVASAPEMPPATPITSAPEMPSATSVPVIATLQPRQFSLPANLGLPFVVDHFLHNLVTSSLIFPDSPQFLSVRSIVKEGEDFWRPRWNGSMSPLATFMLVFSLAGVAFGLGTAVQRDRLRGLVPIAGLLLYLAANSLARTSGGRYIVPVDWILIGYFSIAIAELVHTTRSFIGRGSIATLTSPSAGPRARHSVAPKPGNSAAMLAGPLLQKASRPLVSLILVLLLGSLIPLAGVLYPRRYADTGGPTLFAEMQKYVPQAAGSVGEIEAFLQHPDAVLLQGRLLYPLHYRWGQGEPTRYAPYTARDYPRTVFMLIGPHGMSHVLLPGDVPALLPNASDAIVLGCWDHQDNLISALAVALPVQQTGMTRSPAAPLSCPLPEPVCDNNGNCH